MAQRLNDTSDASFKDSTIEYLDPHGQVSLEENIHDKHTPAPRNQPKSFRDTKWRWVQLTLCVVFFIGNYYCYLVPATLQTSLMKQLKITGDMFKYNMIQAVYSLPNMIMPFFGGLFIDRLGMGLGIFIFSTLLLVGQIVQWQAAVHEDYAFFLVGRVIFGLGGENMCITMNAFIAKWFLGTELSFALAVSVSSANLGTVLTALTQPALSNENDGLCSLPLLVSVGLMTVSWISAFFMIIIERRADKSDRAARRGSKATQSTVHEVEKVQIKDLKEFPALYWLINLLYMFVCAGLIPFQTNISGILIQDYSLNQQQAGFFMAIPMILAVSLTPAFGMLTDHIGKRAHISLLSSIVLSLSFVLFLVLPDCEPTPLKPYGSMGCNKDFIIPLVINGVGAALFSAIIYPCIALVCNKRILGTAYGVLDCAQQIGMALAPMLAGVVLNAHKMTPHVVDPTITVWYNYESFYFLFLGMCAAGILISFGMIILDARNGNKLDKRMTKVQQAQEAGTMSVRLKASFAKGSMIQ